MKKLLITIMLFIITNNVFAANIEILPTMQSKTNVQDRVWVSTFQLVWNDLMDKFVFGEVRFLEGTPIIVENLNQKEFTVSDISGKSYYKYAGKIVRNTKKTIEKALKKKFNEKSDILDKLDLKPNNENFLIYAMLKKDFEFTKPFDKLGKSNFRDKKAEFFGINRHSNDKLKDGVKVLFYNSDSDFAVVLSTTSNDEVFLYKTSNTKPFNYIYEDMNKKHELYRGNCRLGAKDELKVPNLKFFEEKQFDELKNKRIKGTRYKIDNAIETVKFEMNNKGVKLKSEAAITMLATSLNPSAFEPRYFYFNDTFVIFLKEQNKSKPYFALRVFNIDNFQ